MNVTSFRAKTEFRRFDAPAKHLEKKGAITLNDFEFVILKELQSIFNGKSTCDRIENIFKNISFIVNKMMTNSNDIIIIGASPYDPHIPIFQRFASQHNVIFHTSWPYWDGNFVPHSPYIPKQRQYWEDFVEDLPSVGVTKAATEALSDLGADAHHIPHAVDTSIYTPDAGGVSDSIRRILFVGRLVEHKGIEDLLTVAQNWDGPETEFVFVGEGPLSERVREAANDDNVVYHGYVSDERRLAELYASSDVLALPSYPTDFWEELFGIVVIEAFAAGTPVVTTDCVGPEEMVDHGETGYVVERRNIEALKQALRKVVEDDDLRERLSTNARTIAVNDYDLNTVADMWLSVLQDASQ